METRSLVDRKWRKPYLFSWWCLACEQVTGRMVVKTTGNGGGCRVLFDSNGGRQSWRWRRENRRAVEGGVVVMVAGARRGREDGLVRLKKKGTVVALM
jgi:hypothetical protein